MKEELLNSSHLYKEPAREALFDVICLDIEGSRGENTIWLEDLVLAKSSKKVCSLEFNLAKESNHSVTIGLNTYQLKYGKNCIGRFEDNDIIIDSKAISRRHCCIVVHSDETMEIFDTASKNGTRVNGKKIQKSEITPGDEITLGHFFTLIISSC